VLHPPDEAESGLCKATIHGGDTPRFIQLHALSPYKTGRIERAPRKSQLLVKVINETAPVHNIGTKPQISKDRALWPI
jgi:hypothetical protein